MSITLLSSPLQGFTDFRFRNAFQSYFEGIDTYYAPYIRLDGKKEIKSALLRDISLKNNSSIKVIPQIMTNNANDFLKVAQQVKEMGYDELNWNLGCPYPMVTKRGMGSGLLKDPSKIDKILHQVFAESDIKISIKMRLGYENSDEIFSVLPILDKYTLENIAIHPRIGKQLYKGQVDLDIFEQCLNYTHHTICYNGDINTIDRFREMEERFPNINHWMIGRGLIADPFLPAMIRKNNSDYPEDRIERFRKFHDTLFNDYQKAYSGPSHLLMKMMHFWEYFCTAFPNSPKGFKMFKKAKNIRAYEQAVNEILMNA